MFTLKKIDSTEAELLSKLCTETYMQAYKGVHEQHGMDSYCHNHYGISLIESLLSADDTEVVVAYQGAEPAGFYVIKHHPCPVVLTGQSTELKKIYVLSEYFGNGLGHELFNSAVNHAQNNNSKWLWLCVSDINYRAKAFYEKTGFSKVGQGPDLIIGKDTLSSSIMALCVR